MLDRINERKVNGNSRRRVDGKSFVKVHRGGHDLKGTFECSLDGKREHLHHFASRHRLLPTPQ